MFTRGPKQLQNPNKAGANTRCQRCLQLGHHTFQCTNSRPYVPRPSQSKQLAMGSDKKAEPSVVTPDEFKSSATTSGVGLADKILKAKEKEREKFKAEQAKKEAKQKKKDKGKKRSPSPDDSDSDSDISSSSSSSGHRARPRKPVHKRSPSPSSDSASDRSASPPPRQRRRYSTSPSDDGRRPRGSRDEDDR